MRSHCAVTASALPGPVSRAVLCWIRHLACSRGRLHYQHRATQAAMSLPRCAANHRVPNSVLL